MLALYLLLLSINAQRSEWPGTVCGSGFLSKFDDSSPPDKDTCETTCMKSAAANNTKLQMVSYCGSECEENDILNETACDCFEKCKCLWGAEGFDSTYFGGDSFPMCQYSIGTQDCKKTDSNPESYAKISCNDTAASVGIFPYKSCHLRTSAVASIPLGTCSPMTLQTCYLSNCTSYTVNITWLAKCGKDSIELQACSRNSEVQYKSKLENSFPLERLFEEVTSTIPFEKFPFW